MDKRVLVVSQNDKWHKMEDLGDQIAGWARTLEGVQVGVSHDRSVLGRAALDTYDVCVLCTSMEGLTDAEEVGIARYVDAGKGLIGIHAATVIDEGRETLIDVIGARFDHHPPYASFDVRVIAPDHPVVAGLGHITFSD